MNRKLVDSTSQYPVARPCVAQVFIEPVQVWFHCPCCHSALEGFFSDPRGQNDVVCDDCGGTFDIPAGARIVIA